MAFTSTMLLLWISLFRVLVTAIEEVESITMVVHKHVDSATYANTTLTLWFNYTIYEFKIIAPNSSTTYTSTPETLTIVGLSACPQNEASPEAYIVVENYDMDGIDIDKIRFDLHNTDWFGIDQFCIQSTQVKDGWYEWMESSLGGCESDETQFDAWCIDTELHDCAPPKQKLAFDLQKKNQYLSTAIWSDATNVSFDTKTCEPSASPTKQPSRAQRTQGPTLNAAKSPTKSYTRNPTKNHVMKITNTISSDTISSTLNKSQKTQKVDKWAIYIIIVIIIIVLLCVALIIALKAFIHVNKEDAAIVNEKNLSAAVDVLQLENVQHVQNASIEVDERGMYTVEGVNGEQDINIIISDIKEDGITVGENETRNDQIANDEFIIQGDESDDEITKR